jgi:hypothetical protein
MSWTDIKKQVRFRAGTAGTETFNSGTAILSIIVVGAGGASMTLPSSSNSGATVTVPMPSSQPWELENHHLSHVLQGTGGNLQIVFTSTVSYFVEYVELQA